MTHSTLRQHLGDKNIMAIDFETLDLTETAVALSCGIVIFNAMTGETEVEEEALLDVEQQIRQGRTMSGSTLKWWIEQALKNPDAAKYAFGVANTEGADVLPATLDMAGFCESVAQTYEEYNCQWITACGVQFDVKLLENLMKQCGVVPPWRHNQVFDQRTLYLLNQNNVPKDSGREKGVFHRAKDDAAWVRDYILAVCSYEEVRAKDAERYALLREEVEKPYQEVLCVTQNIGHDWMVVTDLDKAVDEEASYRTEPTELPAPAPTE